MKKRYYCFTFIVLILSVISFQSCSKSSDISSRGDGTTAIVEFNLGGVEFQGDGNIGNRAASPVMSFSDEQEVLRNTLDIGNDMLLIAEISPETPAIKSGSSAAIERTDLDPSVRYRVVVYNEDGSFNRQQEYIRGQEGSVAPMMLDGGVNYTFIVYSINTTAATPAPTYSPSTQTLTNARVSVAGNQDFMSFKTTMQLVGGPEPNRLDIILKHRFSQITTTIDATQTGYNPQSITASFGPHSTTATYLFENEEILRGAETSRASLTQNLGGTALTASYPTIINATANTLTDYQIASLRVGELTLTNLNPFQNLTVTPGVKYNLLLRLVPTDEYVEHAGRPAARINGVIWARHNLGADPTLDPDAAPMDVTRHGDYHQWGRLLRSGTATSNNPNPFFGSNEPANNTWNSGTDADPIKTTNDPCPTGYRLPSRIELDILIAAVIPSNMGPFTAGTARFDSAKILTSKRNSEVKLTIPAQGRFNVAGGNAPPYSNIGIINRGSNAAFWTSFSTANPRVVYTNGSSTSFTSTNLGNNRASKSISHPIRCVADL